MKTAGMVDLDLGEIITPTTHPSDLRAATGAGYRTALALRPLERGPERVLPREPNPDKGNPLVEDF